MNCKSIRKRTASQISRASKFSRLLPLVFLLVLGSGAQATASTLIVDFQDTTPGSGTSFTSYGFRFFNPSHSFFVESDGTNQFLFPGVELVVMSRLDSSPFDLIQLDYVRLILPSPQFEVVPLIGFFDDGSSQILSLHVESPTFQTFYVGWANVRFVHFGMAAEVNASYGVDNIVTDVPEPSTLLLLGLGLAGVLMYKRRDPFEQRN